MELLLDISDIPEDFPLDMLHLLQSLVIPNVDLSNLQESARNVILSRDHKLDFDQFVADTTELSPSDKKQMLKSVTSTLSDIRSIPEIKSLFDKMFDFYPCEDEITINEKEAAFWLLDNHLTSDIQLDFKTSFADQCIQLEKAVTKDEIQVWTDTWDVMYTIYILDYPGNYFNKMKDKMFRWSVPDDAPSCYKLVADLQKIEIHNTTPIGEIINILESIPIEFKMINGV